ncbi:MAG: orotidine-5'-phosphate decarboxylase [Oscillospiraceae bacterium]|jgi:orotidine-5'-phosphate decarboxylase|nr:orotidine-5'-phosphate decarboxylase [Oscillospiraceae bacterium]
MSLDPLIIKIAKLQNPTVLGLDPKLEYVPEFIRRKAYDKHGFTLKGAAKAVLEYNKGLINALADTVPAIKPQSAYYELLGYHGVKVLARTIEYAHKAGMYVVLDGKRNDIGTTMEAYAAAYLGGVKVGDEFIQPFGCDAMTINGYLGADGIDPVLKECKQRGKGAFVLAKTSNPSSGELQDKTIDGLAVYERMVAMCEARGAEIGGEFGFGGLGAVVGATYPEQLAELRAKYKSVFFLVPGYGAQGGKASDVAKAFDENGLGAIVNSSRAIMTAYQKEKCDERDFAGAAKREAVKMRDAIMNEIGVIKIK